MFRRPKRTVPTFDEFMEGREPSEPRQVKVEITEKRAPTEDSVKLLREMEEAALRNLIGRVPVGILGATADFSHWVEPQHMGTRVRVRCKLNGVEIESITEIGPLETWSGTDVKIRDVIDRVIGDFAKVLAFRILNPVFQNNMNIVALIGRDRP